MLDIADDGDFSSESFQDPSAGLGWSLDSTGAEVTDIDAHGDLILVCGNDLEIPWTEEFEIYPRIGSGPPATPFETLCANKITDPSRFRVCSRAMARISPVFERMLYGQWKESQKPTDGSDWTVELPCDNPLDMRIFLVHCHFGHATPSRDIHIDQLFGLLVLADKYDTFKAMSAWLRHCVASIESRPHLDFRNAPNAFCVAWKLGIRNLALEAGKRLIINSYMPNYKDEDPKGRGMDGATTQQLHYCGQPLSEMTIFVPEHVIDEIASERLRVLSVFTEFSNDPAKFLFEPGEAPEPADEDFLGWIKKFTEDVIFRKDERREGTTLTDFTFELYSYFMIVDPTALSRYDSERKMMLLRRTLKLYALTDPDGLVRGSLPSLGHEFAPKEISLTSLNKQQLEKAVGSIFVPPHTTN